MQIQEFGQKAIKEAQILGVNVKTVASSEESNFNHIPRVGLEIMLIMLIFVLTILFMALNIKIILKLKLL